jgi:hypothetical protein
MSPSPSTETTKLQPFLDAFHGYVASNSAADQNWPCIERIRRYGAPQAQFEQKLQRWAGLNFQRNKEARFPLSRLIHWPFACKANGGTM